MKLQIKYEKEKFPVEIFDTATVKDLKRHIGKMKNCKISQIQLIYASEVLQNSQTLESRIKDPNKPIRLFINELIPKKKKKTDQNSENNFLPDFGSPLPSSQIRDESFFQLAQYVSKPNIRKLLYDPDIQNGLQMIYRGIEMCHNSGNTNYDNLLENLKLMMPVEQYSPTPPPSSSSSASSLAVSSIHDSNTEKVTNMNVNEQANNTETKNTENKTDADYMTLYKDKLQEMEEMGLENKEINLKALIENNGDVDDAIEWMIQNGDLKEQ